MPKDHHTPWMREKLHAFRERALAAILKVYFYFLVLELFFLFAERLFVQSLGWIEWISVSVVLCTVAALRYFHKRGYHAPVKYTTMAVFLAAQVYVMLAMHPVGALGWVCASGCLMAVIYALLETPKRALGWGLVTAVIIPAAFAWRIYRDGESFYFGEDVLYPVAAVAVIFIGLVTFLTRWLTRDFIEAIRLSESMHHEVVDANIRLISAHDEAVEASKAKSIFLANMSHELRTPLNAIIGYVELIREDMREEKVYDREVLVGDLGRIHHSAHHLLQLISDILDISKIEAGKTDVALEPVDVRQVIDEVVETLDGALAKRSNVLNVVIDDQISRIYSDPMKLRQILLNLVGNATKFTKDGQITVRVIQVIRSDTPWLQLQVEDTGIGIPRDHIEELFNPFVQADSKANREYGGTGLGLAISSTFCELLGGSISVESEVGKGSTFSVELPLGPADKASHPTDYHSISGGRKSAQNQRTSTANSPENVVLVVDDDPDVHDILKRILEREGFEVHSVFSGREVVERARALKPDFITLDVLLPETDGWQILSTLKADPELEPIPVIMLSILAEKNRGFALGASDYLLKPIDRQHLLRALEPFREVPTPTFLVVEDDATTRDILWRTLQPEGWSVLVAKNGLEALELLHTTSTPPQVVITDLMMPKMDGFELINSLKHNPQYAETPILVVTAMDLDSATLAQLNHQVSDIVQKEQFSSEAFLKQVDILRRQSKRKMGEASPKSPVRGPTFSS